MHLSTDPGNPAIWMQIAAARLGFIIAFEHFVFFITGIVDWIIPDIPEHVQTAIEREKYLGKEALRAKEASPLLDRSPLKSSQLSSLPEEYPPGEGRSPSTRDNQTSDMPTVSSLQQRSQPDSIDTFHQIESLQGQHPPFSHDQQSSRPADISRAADQLSRVTDQLSRDQRANSVTSKNRKPLKRAQSFQTPGNASETRETPGLRTKDDFELSELPRDSYKSNNKERGDQMV